MRLYNDILLLELCCVLFGYVALNCVVSHRFGLFRVRGHFLPFFKFNRVEIQ